MSDEQKVGYGNPPRHSRWQPGQSGNQGLRKVEKTTGLIDASAILDRLVKAKVGDRIVEIDPYEASFSALTRKAIGGCLRSARIMLQLCERGMLFAMLSNRIYLGEIVHKGEAMPGEHDAIIPPDLWDAVQQTIARGKVERKTGINLRAPSLLAGILHDGHGRRMSPSHAVKGGKRYRYYITPAAGLGDEAPPPYRMPAHDLEAAVVQRLKAMLLDRRAIGRLVDGNANELGALLHTAATTAAKLDVHHGRTTIIGALVTGAQVEEDRIVIDIDQPSLRRILGLEPRTDTQPLILTAPAIRIRHGKDVKLILATDDGAATGRDPTLVGLIAEAHIVRDAVLASPALSMRAIATQLGKCSTRAARLMRIAWLAPEIVEAISEGRHPPRLTSSRLLATDLPVCWTAQRKMLGIA